ncbi:hypothetical protein SAMN05444171_7073 [Bradyrhizobium lablabi]|jgi:hypothetical protein|uniref:Uncharacterized protein n=2 Tax=Bradyrhizobium TaxID=374 RepID=A0ABY0P5L9_9BRAD|nr:hypothetical protein SAMN05444163_0095 [Bradyrhizobium ottawaense]SEE33438.1 hypothetical protein SAMN05444171_7073 [Bradyrhizobium lablabi]SHM29942.1 hypothetical protein SAMN05444321_5882 [Bradyrhizobium lablabi]
MIHAVTGMRARGGRHMKWLRSGLHLLLLGLYGRFGLSVTSLHATSFNETPGKDT